MDSQASGDSLVVMKVAGRTALAVVIAIASLVVWGGLAQGTGPQPKTAFVSVKSNGSEVNTDNDSGAVSANGRFVAFESGGQFTAGDSGSDHDVFVHDLKTGRTARASLKSNGHEATGDSEQASISANGRYVAFASDAKLSTHDTNGVADVYVHDMKTGKTTRVSVATNGGQGLADSGNPSISADGRQVAFESDAPLAASDLNGVADVYVHDMRTGKTVRASVAANGSELAGGGTLSQSGTPNRATRISADGRFVVFQSPDQAAGGTDCCSDPLLDSDVFVRDLKQKTTTRVSVKQNGNEPDPLNQVASVNGTISANGRFVAFQTAGVFAASDANLQDDIYVKDLKTGKVTRASVASNGSEGASSSDLPSISADGTRVAFETVSDLVGSDGNGYRDIYMRKIATGKTVRVSVKTSGAPVDANHQLAVLSGDGHSVAFSTMGAFTGADTGSDFDVYERSPLK